jgi:hypothetical protein
MALFHWISRDQICQHLVHIVSAQQVDDEAALLEVGAAEFRVSAGKKRHGIVLVES